jgi:hypothetical protein
MCRSVVTKFTRSTRWASSGGGDQDSHLTVTAMMIRSSARATARQNGTLWNPQAPPSENPLLRVLFHLSASQRAQAPYLYRFQQYKLQSPPLTCVLLPVDADDAYCCARVLLPKHGSAPRACISSLESSPRAYAPKSRAVRGSPTPSASASTSALLVLRHRLRQPTSNRRRPPPRLPHPARHRGEPHTRRR